MNVRRGHSAKPKRASAAVVRVRGLVHVLARPKGTRTRRTEGHYWWRARDQTVYIRAADARLSGGERASACEGYRDRNDQDVPCARCVVPCAPDPRACLPVSRRLCTERARRRRPSGWQIRTFRTTFVRSPNPCASLLSPYHADLQSRTSETPSSRTPSSSLRAENGTCTEPFHRIDRSRPKYTQHVDGHTNSRHEILRTRKQKRADSMLASRLCTGIGLNGENVFLFS